MKIRPTRDHVVVRVEIVKPSECKTASGIILGTKETKPKCRGIVEAVGSGRVLNNGERLPMEVSVGDTIIFYDYVGVVVERTDDHLLLLIKENDIIAILKD